MRVEMGERWLIASDFRKARLSEVIGGAGDEGRGRRSETPAADL